MKYNNRHIEQFVVVDDVGVTLFLCKVHIQKTYANMNVLSFDDPARAIDYFKNYFSIRPLETILLLDVNMPQFSGWDVLELLGDIDTSVKEKITIFMLTSSINPLDRQRAEEHPFVSGYLDKPLTGPSLVQVLRETEASEQLML